MSAATTFLGIDVGSMAVSVVEIDAAGHVLQDAYALHGGAVRGELARLLERFDGGRVRFVACTTSTPSFVRADARFDGQLCALRAAKHLHPGLGSLLVVGGETFQLFRFNEDGTYHDSRANSSCAAGTGSFLDQQAKRLGLPDSAALSAMALASTGAIPRVASRCAVFAKTDLIHAQQEGFAPSNICTGLCQGLAANVVDAVFSGQKPVEPVVFAGGVSRNLAVAQHLEQLLDTKLVVDEHSAAYGAFGAALLAADARTERMGGARKDWNELLEEQEQTESRYYEPLELRLSNYPEFSSERRSTYTPHCVSGAAAVEVDLYRRVPAGARLEVELGIDIGSTSTKAVLLGDGAEPVLGLYTRTAGHPLRAVQALFEAISAWLVEDGVELRIAGAGTTGSGRKLLGTLIGADLILDEITAHAKAAHQLDPEVDTIIEIGGQDAKFTVMKGGRVTLSVMNNVCAAGTGSFIEEQAQKLGCPLGDYAARTAGKRAPLVSDRCTVFMERDLNHYLSEGCSVDELLAAALHSVRENYLRKVAKEGAIGQRIAFQGATAKNRSLVAAFEQRLRRPLQVSRYCHLTGALGVALALRERSAESRTATRFRGLALHREEIPVRSEECDLCKNHCKLRVAEVLGETAAYGFLCDRDYGVERYVNNQKGGFELLRARRRAFKDRLGKATQPVTIGIPAGLYLHEEIPLWQHFFGALGFATLTSEGYREATRTGKALAGAEFCAPMAAFHGHVAELSERADYVFVPVYIEDATREPGTRRQYCYYSQYASPLASLVPRQGLRERCLSPLIEPGEPSFQSKARLFATLRALPGVSLRFFDVSAAYDAAYAFYRAGEAALRRTMSAELAKTDDVAVVLLGRPYSVLSPAMNKGIPDIFARLGVKAFAQDMVSYTKEEVLGIEPLLRAVHWRYAAQSLEVAEVVAAREGVYPVLVTSFKCAPDSCVTEYLERIFAGRNKPYLILQLDDHDSQVGYETRIEAAVRSFRNHARSKREERTRSALPINPIVSRTLGAKRLLVPCWDPLLGPLFVANLRAAGWDAHLLEETELTIQRSLSHNDGQCIPLNAAVQSFVDYVDARGIEPRRTALWIPGGTMPCNFGVYPEVTKTLLERFGRGFEDVEVYRGELVCTDVSLKTGLNAYFAYMFGGYLRRLGCKVRPYEIEPGETDRVAREAVALLAETFADTRRRLETVAEVVRRFRAIRTRPARRSKVALFGDLYSRDNDVFNQGVIGTIEKHGGEVLTMPFSEYARVTKRSYFRKWFREGNLRLIAAGQAVLAATSLIERPYIALFEQVLGPEPQPRRRRSDQELFDLFALKQQHAGESFDNILKIFHVVERCPDVGLFVQLNPAFCCPSLVTQAMASRIEEVTGVPIVTITYDGTASRRNDAIIPYLRYPRRRATSERDEEMLA